MILQKNNTVQKTDDREIVITRIINTPRERAFEAMTDPKQVVNWWGPNGFTTTIHEMDVKPGGVWRHTMHGPDGTDYPNKSIFIEIAKPERVVYTNAGGKKDGPGVTFTATWTFEAVGDRTKLTMQLVFPSTEMCENTAKKYGAVEGGQQTLQRLAEHLAKKPAFELVIEKMIDAPRARVFEAWSKPEQLKRWFAPKPYTLIIEKMDFRPGGSFSMAMRSPDGVEHSFAGIYREVVPPARIIWTAEFLKGPVDQISTEVTFEEHEKKTTITVRQTFAVLTPETEPHTRGAKQGWTATLNQLAGHVTNQPL